METRNNILTFWDTFKSLIPTFGKHSLIMLTHPNRPKVEIKLLKVSQNVKILFLVSLLFVAVIIPYLVFLNFQFLNILVVTIHPSLYYYCIYLNYVAISNSTTVHYYLSTNNLRPRLLNKTRHLFSAHVLTLRLIIMTSIYSDELLFEEYGMFL